MKYIKKFETNEIRTNDFVVLMSRGIDTIYDNFVKTHIGQITTLTYSKEISNMVYVKFFFKRSDGPEVKEVIPNIVRIYLSDIEYSFRTKKEALEFLETRKSSEKYNL